MLKAKRSGQFLQDLKLLCKNNEPLLDFIEDKIFLFIKKPSDTRLRNHALKRHMKGKWAFSVTGDIRVVYKWTNKKTVRFLAIGSHKRVYRRRK